MTVVTQPAAAGRSRGGGAVASKMSILTSQNIWIIMTCVYGYVNRKDHTETSDGTAGNWLAIMAKTGKINEQTLGNTLPGSRYNLRVPK